MVKRMGIPTRPRNNRFLILLFLIWPCLNACSEKEEDKTPGIEPITANLKTVVPLAYAATQAMQSVSGNYDGPALISNTCTTFPCLATVDLPYSREDMPVALGSGGNIFIAGLWTAADQAIMTFSFSGTEAGTSNYPILKISTIPVSVRNGETLLIYSSTDINIAEEADDTVVLDDTQVQAELDRLGSPVTEDAELNVNMDAFVIKYSNDSYRVSGGGQYITLGGNSTSVLQLGMANVTIGGNCKINPVAGFAVINELKVSTGEVSQWPKLGVASIDFDSTCDGKARVVAAIGSYGVIAGKSIDLGF